ncbi:MAG: ATP-binding cassette domain-containing protein [Clostridium sp.]|nr:ATP-binding cassette domain-containing protein [Clostridium sp.]
MFKIFRYMKDQWYWIVFVIVLLIVQAQCDLSLPEYTSKIIDTGIQNQGIEHGVPELITGEEYQKLTMFMTKEEQADWESIYEETDDGNYHLTITEDPERWTEADQEFQTVILLNASMRKMSEESLQTMTEKMLQARESDRDQMIRQMREEMESQTEQIGSTMLTSIAISYAAEEYQAAGGDIHALQRQYLLKTGGKMLALTLLMAAAAIAAGFLAARIGAKVGMELRGKVFKKVVTFTNREMDQFSTASLITRSTNDIQQVQMVSTMMLRMLIYAPILGIGGVIHVLNTGAGMEWIILVAVVTILVFVGILMKIAMPKFKQMQQKVDGLNLISREILTGLMVIRAFVREDVEEERFDEANKDLTKTMLFTNRVMTFMMPVMMLLMNGVSVLIVWVAANRIDAGVMQVGTMTAFITYTMQIVMAFLVICMFSIMLPRAGVAVNRIEEVLDTKVLVQDAEGAGELTDVKGYVEFHHVDFKYPGAEECVLEDIDFTAEPGKTTAIIGSTGCGKSTLIQLIPRFYDVTNGRITIDGTDIREVTQESLRNQIGLVPQKGILFSGTIASNLRFGKEDATEEELEKAAEIAQATEFINEKSEKYDSSIAQGGSNVSGGQKQRLSIARAIAKNPKIYIFDDSFSALDFKTDAALRKALGDNVKDSTVIIVAQRISTILHADQILVLDDGRIVGKGTHESLLKDCEVYQQIARSQLSEQEIAKSQGKEAGSNE